MRLSPAHSVGTLVLLLAGVASAEPPEGGQRFVRTSLEGAPVLEYRSPPRVITASLDGRETEVLGGAPGPRQLRRSLDDAVAPPDLLPAVPTSAGALPPGASPAAAAASNAGLTNEDLPSTAAPSDGLTGIEESTWTDASNDSASAPRVATEQGSYGALDCDCARTRRQIRLTLDGSPAERAPEVTRIIRVQL